MSRKDDRPQRRSLGTLVFEMGDRILYEADASVLASHPVVIGRDTACDWCTAGIDPSVSLRHAEIFRRRRSVWIRDIGSRNGIFFRGERVSEHRLSVGESVLVGACKVTLEPPRRDPAAEGTAHHRLEQTNGPGAGRVLELAGDADLIIGSDPACDIFVPDTLVSRRHARLSFKKDGTCWVSDLGGRNGTTVGGVPVPKDKERMLLDGAVLSVAYVEFRFLDKGAVHVRARVGRKLLVAAATLAFGVMGMSFWMLASPGAGRLLARTQDRVAGWSPESSPEDFAPAFALLAEAANARQAEKYAADWTRQLAQMEAYTNTIAGWQAVRDLLSHYRWVRAQERFHELSSWTWNATTAPAARAEADSVQSLVNAFLDARADLWREDWRLGTERPGFQARLSALETALAAAPDAPPTPIGAPHTHYLSPLRAEALDLAAEFRHALDAMEAIDDARASLRRDSDGSAEPAWADSRNGPPPASRALASLEKALAAEQAHVADETAKENAKEPRFRRPRPFVAPIVTARLAESLPPLRALADGERQLAANLDAIASARWDSVRRELDFPPRAVTDAAGAEFMEYRDTLTLWNRILCGTSADPGRANLCAGFRTRLASLESRGFGPFLSSPPPALSALLDPALLDEALRFVDPVATPVPPLDTAAPPCCPYDRFVGLYAFDDFLRTLSFEGPLPEAVKAYATACRERSEPVVVAAAREAMAQLRDFRRFADSSLAYEYPDLGIRVEVLPRLVLEDRPADGTPNRCAEALVNATRLLRRVADWRATTLPEAVPGEDGASRPGEPSLNSGAPPSRASLLVDGITLLLADSEELRRQAFAERAQALGTRYKTLISSLKSIDREGEADPAAARRRILATGLPGDGPYRKAWRKTREEQEPVP